MRLLIPIATVVLTCLTGVWAQAPGSYMGEITWPEAEQKLKELPIVIIPFGAGAKEHGPQLPMNADQKVMEFLCQRAVESEPVLVAPPILHGWFPAFREFPGTEVADHDAFIRYVLEVAKSLVRSGAQRIVFLNTGISRATGLPLSIAAREIRTGTGTPTLVVSWDDLETEEITSMEQQKSGGHADEMETSIHLFLQPSLVHMERAVPDERVASEGFPGYQPGLYSRSPQDPRYSTTGLTGNPTLATAEKGQKALEVLSREWIKALRGFAKVPLRR